MENRRFLHRISLLLLALIMISQLIPMSVFAADTSSVPSVAYDSGGNISTDVQCVGEVTNPWGDTFKDYRAEIKKGTAEIYIRFNLDQACHAFNDVNEDTYIEFQNTEWVKINLNSNEWPFDSELYKDINSDDADDYRNILIGDEYDNYIGSILLHYVDSSGGEPGDESDKSSLINEITRVTGDNAANWHQADDRYNGKEYIGDDGSFWDSMQTTLTAAQSVYEDDNSYQETVDEAANGLQHSIDNLIPIVNVNPTKMYEAINQAPPEVSLPGYLDFTQASWQAYNDAVDEAQELLDSLYDSDGEPTDKNDSSDTDLLAEIEDKIDDIEKARESMDPLLPEDNANDFRLKYKTLNDLLNVYKPEGLDESLYTPDSWSTFLEAYESTEEYLRNNSAPGDDEVGKKQYDEVNQQYEELWRGINGLEDKKDSITVTIKVVDSLHARLGEALNDKLGIHTVTLNGDKTLNAAVDKLENEVLSSPNYIYSDPEDLYVTSINGILTTKPYGDRRGIEPLHFKSPERTPDEKSYYAVQLHDGDIVTLAFLEQPVKKLSAGGGHEAFEEKWLHNFYKQSAILQDGEDIDGIIEVDEGQELNLSAIYTLPHISTYSDKTYSLEGATVFVSEAADKEDDISPANININTVTGEGGELTYEFYSPGYYALSVYDLRENNIAKGFGKTFHGDAPGLTIGDTIYVHVNGISAEQVEVIKERLKQELNTLYIAYPESFFSANDWIKINNFYETGISAIDEAKMLEEAKKAWDKAFTGIKVILDKTVSDNTSKMEGFRAILSRLPSDILLLGQRNVFLAEELITRYDSMSDYQKNQLTGLEVEKYSSVKDAYDKGLPELEPYKLNIEVAADSPSAKAAIEDMIEYVIENGKDTDILYNFKIAERNIDGESISPQIGKRAYPDNFVSFTPSLGIFTYSFKDEVIQEEQGWTILKDGLKLEPNTAPGQSGYIAVKEKTILIGGTSYEIKSVEATGVYDINREQDSVKDINNKNIVFPDALCNFIMPYQDVMVTVTWSPVDDSTNPDDNPELALAKTNAIDEIKETYSKYKSNKYEDDKWVELVNAKNTGIDEVLAAKTIDEVIAAKEKAIAAMAAVEEKLLEGIIPGFGRIVGTVDVYVENTTFDDGDFTGRILKKNDFDYAEKDTMMTIILRALAEDGYGWTGTGGTKPQGIGDYKIEYLSSITKDGESLGEFSGDPGSGWMGTLNDFFVNEGFQQFSVDNGKISSGDEIRVMFTQNLGEDLGGTWGNSDTSLAKLRLSEGEIYPSFSSNINTYTLVIPSETDKLKVTPTASNRNYLVKTFLNDKVTSNKEGVSFYKRTQYIPVHPGDFINIGVGEYAWPSMNNQESEKIDYTGTWYKLYIITPDNGAQHVISLISELPSEKRITISDEDTIKNIRNVFEALSSSEQSKVTNIKKLTEAENRIAFLQEIEDVKDLLKKIPAVSKVTLRDKAAVMEADKAYKKLTDKQKLYITVGDVKNYNAAIDKLIELGAFDTGYVPSKIKGSDEIPVFEGDIVEIDAKTKVINGEAISKVTKAQIKDILEQIKDSDVTGIIINVAEDKEILKSNIEIPKTSLNDISKEKLDLNIQTPIGTIVIPNKALEKISEQAKGSNVEIIIGKVKEEKLTQEQKATVQEDTIYDISIISKEKKISSFGGKQITISLPYTLKKGQIKDKVSIWYLNDKGELEKIQCRYDEKAGLAIFTTDHLSYYIVGYDSSRNFIDVKEDDWFYQSVMYAVQKGLFTGTSETTFSPNSPMTRGMLVAVLYRLDGASTVDAVTNRFTDVKDGQWYTEAIKWSSEKAIVNGITETEFKPQNNITREQLAVMLYRYAKIKGLNTEVKGNIEAFSDKQNISNWAKEAMTWAVANGLLTGRENSILDPSGNATRAEVSAILQRFVENVKYK